MAGGVGFYVTADDAERLIERTESQHDSAIPSGLGVLVEVLLRLDLAGAAPAGRARPRRRACSGRARRSASPSRSPASSPPRSSRRRRRPT
ncbi:hypothetical protein [Nannocystis pusilla]|uniref:hypothetical protein n=1 Tax=Nannocystis pusilla TaxID=889268 RepID=UPI003B7772CF